MKKLLLILIPLVLLLSCDSKRNKNKKNEINIWAEEEQNVFKSECIKNAMKNVGKKEAEIYCNCMLQESMGKWKSGLEADKESLKMTNEEILEFTEPCR